MFNFREGITFVAAAWKGHGPELGVFLVLYSDDPTRKMWSLFQRFENPVEVAEGIMVKEVETPEHAIQGTLNMLQQIGGLRGLSRLRRVDIQSDSYEVFASKLAELEGVDLQSVGMLGGMQPIGQA